MLAVFKRNEFYFKVFTASFVQFSSFAFIDVVRHKLYTYTILCNKVFFFYFENIFISFAPLFTVYFRTKSSVCISLDWASQTNSNSVKICFVCLNQTLLCKYKLKLEKYPVVKMLKRVSDENDERVDFDKWKFKAGLKERYFNVNFLLPVFITDTFIYLTYPFQKWLNEIVTQKYFTITSNTSSKFVKFINTK